MGMRLPEMQQICDKPPGERDKLRLADAHLPERGFYLIKSQHLKQQDHKPLPYWRRLSSLLKSPSGFSQNSLSSHTSITGAVLHSSEASLEAPQQSVVIVDIPEAAANNAAVVNS